MGYDLHITRRTEWCDPDSGPPITLAEFQSAVLGRPDFKPDCYVNSALWKPADPDAAPCLWLDDSGEILCKNPPDEFINVMLDIASSLGARVQGDDGEFYELA